VIDIILPEDEEKEAEVGDVEMDEEVGRGVEAKTDVVRCESMGPS
jgi:hypothetical protein